MGTVGKRVLLRGIIFGLAFALCVLPMAANSLIIANAVSEDASGDAGVTGGATGATDDDSAGAGDEKDDRPSGEGDVKDDRPDDADDGPADTQTKSTVTYTEADYAAWQKAYPSLDLELFLQPADPTLIAPHEPTAEDIEYFTSWLEQGGNPRNQVMKQVTEAVGEEIANQMWDYLSATFWQPFMNKANVGSAVSDASGLKNVGAMQEGQFAGFFGSFFGSLFTGRDGGSDYEFQNIVSLINDGFIVSSDGETYRLHNAADGTIAYEVAVKSIKTSDAQAFTLLLDASGQTYYQAGMDKTDELVKKFGVMLSDSLISVSVIPDPDSDVKYPYLYPDKVNWVIAINGDTPSWYNDDSKTAIMSAFEDWKAVAYDFDLEGFLAYFDTLPMEAQTPTDEEISLLKEWAVFKNDPANDDLKYADDSEPWAGSSIWEDAASYLNDTFGEVYGQCPGPTVVKGITALGITLDTATEDKVGSSVGEKEALGIWFTNTTKWEKSGDSTYPYAPVAKLWQKGFIPSFDGTTWRLSSGKEGTIVYEITLAEILNGETGETSPRTLYIAIGIAAVLAAGTVGFVLVRRRRKSRL